jgi:5-methylcytosine-specific restriction protein A
MGLLKQLPRALTALPHGLKLQPDQGPQAQRAHVPWKNWYSLKRWRDLRIATFIRDHFTCQMCGKLEGDTSKLSCDHKKEHRGDPALFWDADNLQTLCTEPCHVKHKQAQEQATLHQRGTWD